MKIRYILASQSPRRRELLEQIGIVPEILPCGVDETTAETDPETVVRELSRRKASDAAEKTETAEAVHASEAASDGTETCGKTERTVIIGADTVVSAAGRILGKPRTHAEAAEMIRLLEGKTHRVYTGVTLIALPGSIVRTFSEMTEVTVFPMTEAEIRAYADSEEPMDKAGAYGIQGPFAAYIRGICGDYTNVVGLPAGRTWQEIKKLYPDI